MNETMDMYKNAVKGHQLRRYASTGNSLCSCGRWELMGATEGSLIRSHKFHIDNLPAGKKPGCMS